MIIKTETEVFRDKLTGVTYEQSFNIHPVAVLTASGKTTEFGMLLKPFGEHPDVDWDDMEAFLEGDERPTEKFGFNPARWGQDVLVSEELFAERFESLGVKTKEYDMEERLAHFEDERCDFKNPRAVIAGAMRQLTNMSCASLRECYHYALLKFFKEHTANDTAA